MIVFVFYSFKRVFFIYRDYIGDYLFVGVFVKIFEWDVKEDEEVKRIKDVYVQLLG